MFTCRRRFYFRLASAGRLKLRRLTVAAALNHHSLFTIYHSRLLKYLKHRVVDEAVARCDELRVDVEGPSVIMRDATARLFDEQDARSHVPRAQALFVKSVEAPAGDVREVERCGSVAADGLRPHDEAAEVACEVAAL